MPTAVSGSLLMAFLQCCLSKFMHLFKTSWLWRRLSHKEDKVVSKLTQTASLDVQTEIMTSGAHRSNDYSYVQTYF
jgi:hypothetical protein